MIRKIVVGSIAFALLLLIAFYFFAQSQKPTYKGTVDLHGLGSEVEVYFDEFGIPHIYADLTSLKLISFSEVWGSNTHQPKPYKNSIRPQTPIC